MYAVPTTRADEPIGACYSGSTHRPHPSSTALLGSALSSAERPLLDRQEVHPSGMPDSAVASWVRPAQAAARPRGHARELPAARAFATSCARQ